jgi:hypothetical protein
MKKLVISLFFFICFSHSLKAQGNLVNTLLQKTLESDTIFYGYRHFANNGVIYFWDTGLLQSNFDSIRISSKYMLKKIAVREYDILSRKAQKKPLPIIKINMIDIKNCLIRINIFIGYVHLENKVKKFASISENVLVITFDDKNNFQIQIVK